MPLTSQLQTLQAAGTDKQSERCILCLTEVSQVSSLVLLKGCGHDICGDCYATYRTSAAGRRCLVCRCPVAPGDAQKVFLAPAMRQQVTVDSKTELVDSVALPKLAELFTVPPHFEAMSRLDVAGEWSSKVSEVPVCTQILSSHAKNADHVASAEPHLYQISGARCETHHLFGLARGFLDPEGSSGSQHVYLGGPRRQTKGFKPSGNIFQRSRCLHSAHVRRALSERARPDGSKRRSPIGAACQCFV